MFQIFFTESFGYLNVAKKNQKSNFTRVKKNFHRLNKA